MRSEPSHLPLDRRTCVERVPVFGRLPAEDRARLAEELRHRRFQPGEVLTSSDRTSHLTIVAAGLARHAVSSADGREQILRFLGPGDFFGEMALFTGRPMAGEVRAVEPVEACILEGDTLRHAVEASPALGWDLLRELARVLEETTRIAGSLSTQTVDQRIAHFFLRMGAGSRVFELPYSRSETARLLGCARESLTRALRRLQHQGLVRVEGRRVHVRDPEGLRALAGEEVPPATSPLRV